MINCAICGYDVDSYSPDHAHCSVACMVIHRDRESAVVLAGNYAKKK